MRRAWIWALTELGVVALGLSVGVGMSRGWTGSAGLGGFTLALSFLTPFAIALGLTLKTTRTDELERNRGGSTGRWGMPTWLAWSLSMALLVCEVVLLVCIL